MSIRHIPTSPLRLVLAVLLAVVVAAPNRSALAQTGAQSTPDLISSIGAGDAMARAAAACELGKREAAAAIPALVDLLADDTSIAPFTCSRRWDRNDFNSPGREAARALVDIGTRSVEPVLRVLRHALGPVREKAVWILAALDYDEGIDDFIALLGADDYFLVRANAAWALGAIGDRRATSALARALTGDDAVSVRRQAAWALGAVGDDGDGGDDAGVDALVRALRDADTEVREQSAWALGAVGSAAGVDGLAQALGDDSPAVRSQAAWALGAIGDPRASDRLLGMLQDDDLDVRRQAIWALSVIE